jgi:hypothetical protein
MLLPLMVSKSDLQDLRLPGLPAVLHYFSSLKSLSLNASIVSKAIASLMYFLANSSDGSSLLIWNTKSFNVDCNSILFVSMKTVSNKFMIPA